MRVEWCRAVCILAFFVTSAALGRNYTYEECPVVGNSETHVYHVPGDPNYRQMLQENKKTDNRVCFKSRGEAEKAGYRRSRSGQSK